MKTLYEVDLDNLNNEEKENFLKLVQQSLNPKISTGRWRAKQEGTYCTITPYGEVGVETEIGSDYDNAAYLLGNYFKTADEAIFAREKHLIYQQLIDYALTHNTEQINWEDEYQLKYYLNYNMIEQCIDYPRSYSHKNLLDVYFTSEETAKDAVKTIGEEKIKHYLFEINEEE